MLPLSSAALKSGNAGYVPLRLIICFFWLWHLTTKAVTTSAEQEKESTQKSMVICLGINLHIYRLLFFPSLLHIERERAI